MIMSRYSDFLLLAGAVFESDEKVGQVFCCENSGAVQFFVHKDLRPKRYKVRGRLASDADITDGKGAVVGKLSEYTNDQYNSSACFGVSKERIRRFDATMKGDNLHLHISIDAVAISRCAQR